MKFALLVGPTSVGKTAILEELVERFQIPIEVVSCDLIQSYRGLTIGSAKPNKALLQKVPHHLIDILEPEESYTVGKFIALVESAITNILERGKWPILSGGSFFYVHSFLFGLPRIPVTLGIFRKRLQAESSASLYEKLKAVDPKRALELEPNDRQRLMRSLEFFYETEKQLSSFSQAKVPQSHLEYLFIGLDRPRTELYQRINDRVDCMFAQGLTAEVEWLQKKGLTKEHQSMKAIGYREFFAAPPLPESNTIAEKIKQNSRHFAKRQLTFMRKLPDIHWLKIENGNEKSVARTIYVLLQRFWEKTG